MIMGKERNVNIDEHDRRANEHCTDQHRIDKRTHLVATLGPRQPTMITG